MVETSEVITVKISGGKEVLRKAIDRMSETFQVIYTSGERKNTDDPGYHVYLNAIVEEVS